MYVLWVDLSLRGSSFSSDWVFVFDSILLQPHIQKRKRLIFSSTTRNFQTRQILDRYSLISDSQRGTLKCTHTQDAKLFLLYKTEANRISGPNGAIPINDRFTSISTNAIYFLSCFAAEKKQGETCRSLIREHFCFIPMICQSFFLPLPNCFS